MLRRSWNFVVFHGWKFTGLVVVGVIVFLWLIKAPIIGAFISAKTRVPVTLRAASLWPTETVIHHFAINNPRGLGAKPALKAARIEVHYTYNEIASVPSVINEIIFSDVYLNINLLDGTGKNSNWSRIGARIPRSKNPRGMVIHKVIVDNLTVETEGKGAVALGIAGKSHFDQLEFDEINSSNGFPTRELLTELFMNAGIGKYMEDLLNPAARVEETIDIFNY